jgi:hypothetical protein
MRGLKAQTRQRLNGGFQMHQFQEARQERLAQRELKHLFWLKIIFEGYTLERVREG